MADSNFTPVVRPCPKCGASERYSDGKCKACVIARVAKYREKNLEKIREYHAAWRVRNKDKIKASDIIRCAEYRAKNPSKRQATHARYQAANKSKIALKHKQWKKDNPEFVKIYTHNRRVRKLESGGRLTKGITKKLFKLQKGMCPCCGKPLGNEYHMDHIMPLALGGTNTDSNIQLLCPTCNLKKSSKHPVDFMQSRGFLL